jgi:hypothetical protein
VGGPADVLPTRLMAVIVFVLVQMLCAVIRWGFITMIKGGLRPVGV